MCTGCAAQRLAGARREQHVHHLVQRALAERRARLAAAITMTAGAARSARAVEEAIHPRLVLARAAVLPLRAGGGERVGRMDHERARQHQNVQPAPRSPCDWTLFLPYPSKRSSKLGVAFARTTRYDSYLPCRSTGSGAAARAPQGAPTTSAGSRWRAAGPARAGPPLNAVHVPAATHARSAAAPSGSSASLVVAKAATTTARRGVAQYAAGAAASSASSRRRAGRRRTGRRAACAPRAAPRSAAG